MAAVETTLKLLEAKGADWICEETGPIPYDVISACLESFAQNPYEPQEQACTLLFCLMHADGRYLSGHLGGTCSGFPERPPVCCPPLKMEKP